MPYQVTDQDILGRKRSTCKDTEAFRNMVHVNNKGGRALRDRKVREQTGDAIGCVDLRTTIHYHSMLRTLNLTVQSQDDRGTV